MKHKLFLLLLLFSSICIAQEICNNGIDDDGDGKIDLNDSDCICNNSIITSLLPNHSFEEKANCPYNLDDLSAVSPWIKGTIPSPDYINCGILDYALYEKNLENFPDGKGIIRAIYQNNKKEYLGIKLLSPLVAGKKYQLTLNIATLTSIQMPQVSDKRFDFNYLEPVYVTLFGSNNKDNLPLYTNSDPNSFDPTWIEIGYVLYQPQSIWGEITIAFTTNVDINTIMLGPPKILPPSFETIYEPSFLYDNLRLNTAESFGVNITQTGDFCNNNLELTANLTKNFNSDITFQWYKNGIAINRATNKSYPVPSIDSNLGDYAVKITNGSDCFISSILTINNSIPNPSVTVVQPSCQDINGLIKVNNLGMEYSFDNGLTWQSDTNYTSTNPGKYYIKTRTASGCISTPTIVTIINPILLDRPTFSITQPNCNSGGSITITTPASQFSFDNGQTWDSNPNKTNLPLGNYILKVKSSTGCESYSQSVFLFPYYINSPTYTLTKPTCNQGGSITITTPASQYSFDNGVTWSTTSTATNLAPGYYNVRIKNEFGCESKPGYNQIYFDQFSKPYPEIKITQPSSCEDKGSITFLKPSAKYSLDDGLTWTDNQTTTNLPIGNYIIKTKNELGCESERNYATINPYYLPTPTYISTQATCEKNGSVTITTPALEYSFDNGVTWTTNPTTIIPSGTELTAFSIVIKNEFGCKSEPKVVYYYPNVYLDIEPEYVINKRITCDSGESITITTPASEYSFDDGRTWTTNPTANNLNLSYYYLKIKNSYGCISQTNSIYVPFYFNEAYLDFPTYSIIQPSCDNKTGSITITTSAAFYSFDGGKTWETNPTKSNLEEGNYEIAIKSESGCTSFPFNIHIFPFYLDSPTFQITQPTTCDATATGSITITTPADLYSFNGGGTWSTNPTAPNLPVGFQYFIKIKNNQGCTSQSLPVYFTPVKLKPPEYTVIYPTCDKGGTITITTPASFYSFDLGETWGTNPTATNLPSGFYYPRIKNELGCISEVYYSIRFEDFYLTGFNVVVTQPTCESKNKGSITIDTPFDQYSFDDGRTWSQYNIASNLSPGNYYIIVKNNLGCESWWRTVTIYPFYLSRPNYTSTKPICEIGGSITITTPAALYSFDNGKTWDANPIKSNLSSGYYYIKIKNELGCESYPETVYLPQFYLDPPLYIKTQPNCESKGSITITTPASEYSFDNGTTWSTNSSISNLDSGNYYLKIKNDLGCESNYVGVTLYNPNTQPPSPTISIQQPSSCSSTSGSITITTKAALYSFDNGISWSENPTSLPLTPGNYLIKIKNGILGCPSLPANVTINPPLDAPEKPTLTVFQPTTCANPFGSITVTTAASEYSFDNGFSWRTNSNSGNLTFGNYSVKVKNSAGCESVAVTAQINSPTDFPTAPTKTITQPDCINSKGKITITYLASEYSFDNGSTWSTSAISTFLKPGDYYLKIKNTNGCISEASTAIIIPFTDFPQVPTSTSPQTFCIQQNATLSSITITGQNIKWYDALTNGNLFANPTLLQNGTTYFASQTINGCESERIPVLINIQNTATPTGNSPQTFCASQNPTLNTIVITGTNIKWYDSLTLGTILPLSTPLLNGQTYYATQTLNGCESPTRLAITVTLISTLPANNYVELFCDDLNDGTETVNLSSYNSSIISNTTDYYFSYYNSLSGAQNETLSSKLTNFSSYKLVLGDNKIYVRINSNTPCYAVAELNLPLFSKPIINIQDIVPICENKTITIDAGSGFDSYSWSNGATTQTITVDNPDNFSVTVTNDYDTISCSSTKKFTVKKSNKATINTIETKDWTDSDNVITVFATGNGDYQYSIDGVNYQESNQFTGLISGKYTVLVRDKNGCGTATDEVYLLMFPRYFTPNGDGYNDTWKIKFSDIEAGLTVKIFDRYGKIIKVLNTNTDSWDGTYNGTDLPSTDYWFVVTRANGIEYKGHFSLKR